MIFNYLKIDTNEEQRIKAHLLRMTRQFEPKEEFRSPAWVSRETAELMLSEKRSARFADELRRVIAWAETTIIEEGEDLHELAGVLPFRFSDEDRIEVCLITSHNRAHWLIPKGHVEGDESPKTTALREAKEEAGLAGHLVPKRELGRYSYRRDSVDFEVTVFGLLVTEEYEDWEEAPQRRRQWFELDEASEVANEHGLRLIIDRLRRSLPKQGA